MNKLNIVSEFEKVRQLHLLIQSDFTSKMQSAQMWGNKK